MDLYEKYTGLDGWVGLYGLTNLLDGVDNDRLILYYKKSLFFTQ